MATSPATVSRGTTSRRSGQRRASSHRAPRATPAAATASRATCRPLMETKCVTPARRKASESARVKRERSPTVTASR